MSRRSYAECTNNGEKWFFKDLLANNIPPGDILKWSSSVEMIDKYAYFFYNRSAVANANDFLCHCKQRGSFGKYCEYELLFDSLSISDSLTIQFELKKNIMENQRWATVVCYRTLSCDFGILCLDWRNICDGQQQCMDGLDEENCDKLEFNECEEDEFRCSNGMCIDEVYFLDGEPDCMDMSDETNVGGPICHASPDTFACDEHGGRTDLFSCGDGEYVVSIAQLPFQTVIPLYQYCNNLRNINHMCEAWSLEAAWTLPSGMCEFEKNYDDPRYNITSINISSPETCTYLLRCALTNGFERDCPCGRTTSCKKLMISLCNNSEKIQYPNLGLIRPYILYFYSAQDIYHHKVPAKIVLSGSIQCRGYRIEASHTEKLIYFEYDYRFVRNHNKDKVFCSSSFAKRNTSILVKFFPINCWNDSHTFSRLPYYSVNVCSNPDVCISPYRINDGNIDCSAGEDENKGVQVSSCSKIQRHRFQCSSIEPLCLLPWTLTNRRAECRNKFDQYVYGNGTLLRDMTCNHRNDNGCPFLRTYVDQSSMNETKIYEDMYIIKRFPHHAYCNSHWDTNPPIDEHSLSCKEWICPEKSFRCKSNQCIPLQWVCDGEWDCSDASDEQGIFAYKNVSDRNQDVQNLQEMVQKCTTRYATQPFSDICNVSTEFPCLLANVTNPLDINKNRPCIPLTLIGDGIHHCYGGLDERNTASDCGQRMKGFSFHCTHQSACISYVVICVDRCPNQDDDHHLCFYKTKNESCGGISDVICFDGRCIPNARCNGTNDCEHGEDEYWCPFNGNRIGYRLDKHQQQKQQPRRINWLPFPSAFNNTSVWSNNFENFAHVAKKSNAYQNDMTGAFVCNRGLAVRLASEIRCFCSGTYYGNQCQYFNDRITVITHLNFTHTTYEQLTQEVIIIKVIAFYLFESEKVIDTYEFNVIPVLEKISYTKHKFQLVNSRSEQLLKHKQNRYFNRTDIISNHPYSVRFEAFELRFNQTQVLAAWNYPIYFDFLPSFRLATSLRFPETYLNISHNPCTNRTCNSNSICIPFFNNHNWSHSCFCKNGFYGNECQLFDSNCSGYCLVGSICKPVSRHFLPENKQPVCICPFNRFDSRCNLKYDACHSNPCRNNGTCHHTFDPSQMHPFICICHKDFYGDFCQYEKSSINIQLISFSLPNDTFASVIQYYDIDNITFELLPRQQQLFVGIPSQIHFRHAQVEAPILGILKLHVSLTITNYYILYIQPNISVVNIISTPQNCPHASSFFQSNDGIPIVFKYHQICRNNSFLLCFYDSTYLCVCKSGQMQADCFNQDPYLDRCDSCLSNGKCIQGERQGSLEFICHCPYCYSGRLCEFSMQPFTFTLDSLLLFERLSVQLVYIIISFLVFTVGFFNNFCSFITFRRSKPRKLSVGNWLFVVIVLNQCALLCLLIKFLHIFLGSWVGWTDNSSCKAINYLLVIFPRTIYWLTSWITIDRLLMSIFPTLQIIKNPRIAIWSTVMTLFILLGMHIHEILYSISIRQPDSIISSCVISFGQEYTMAEYHRMTGLPESRQYDFRKLDFRHWRKSIKLSPILLYTFANWRETTELSPVGENPLYSCIKYRDCLK